MRFSRYLCTLLVAALAPAAPAAFTTLRETGETNRVNAFFMGDGYTAADITAGTYAAHVQNYADYMFSSNLLTDPYYRYRNYFNLYRVTVISAESGIDVPQLGIVKNTALDATYRFDGLTDRLVSVNNAKASAALGGALSGSGKTANMKFVTVNQSIYGGGGGTYAVYAGGNDQAREIALHEVAHSFSNLADEYEYGFSGSPPAAEPAEANVTKDPTGAKWSRWLGYNDPTGSVVGAYEGARYYATGLYRPTADSKMRTLNTPFNAIDREKIILDIYSIVRPLDSYTPNFSLLTNPAALSASRIDDAVIDTQWFLDGNHLAAADGQEDLNIAGLALAAGGHTISLRAYDPTGFDAVNGWVRMNNALLEQNVLWNISITAAPEPATLFLLALSGTMLLRRRRAKP